MASEPAFPVGVVERYPRTCPSRRVSFEDVPGIKLFAFHARINKPFQQFEEGDYADDITEPSEDGRWVFETTKATITDDQTVHYWVYVQHEDRSYWLANQKQKRKAALKTTTTTTTTTTRVKPKATKTTKPSEKSTTTTEAPCAPTVTTVNGKPSCAGRMVFEDTFQTFDLQKWQREVRIPLDTEVSLLE